ncbi:competence/damage-inducible protein cinA [Halorientalis persicus]|jgi:molybdenum cofactor synthesis domain-containing protein|uniref:Competence/damage-inducible protein cinA n=1 Tax=Halorientalis persicus TaxID=1367881 RepID=A0A1H8NIK7_9EURY|nr:molybdopterin-binding protein [Halorientalis persicus]SEO29434.1 competence/damage-inducible protein cinA [Halorientalis persicus]
MRVALVTVGDELLAGDTVNTNAAWLGERLTERGATVERVTVVPDRIGEIARVVNEYRAEFDAVVVTGGLGPTHDDVTMDGVAAAFGREVVQSDEALAWLESEGGYAREDLADGTADIPAGAAMLPNREGVAPGCVLESVYVLPGVPAEMKAMFEGVADRFSGERRHVETVEADEPESALLTRVRDVRDRFDVKVGSYPGETVEIKLESTDADEVRAAAAWLAERVETPETE